MSAIPFDRDEPLDPTPGDEPDLTEDSVVAGTPVVVRRHAGIAALIGAVASAVAIAYLWRASYTTAALDWVLFGVMALVAAYHLVSLVDSRTPLLVADDLGVRIRLGHDWRGLPWDAIGQVVVHPRQGLLRDGRLVFVPHSLARAVDGLDPRARRHVAMNQKMYGAALAVPVGATTRVSTGGGRSVADQLAALTLGRAAVVELDARTLEPRTDEPVEDDPRPAEARAADDPGARTEAPGRRGTQTSRDSGVPDAPGRRDDRGPSGVPAEAPEAGGHPTGRSDAAGAEVPVGEPGARDAAEGTASAEEADDHDEPVVRTPRRSILGGIGMIVSRVAKGRDRENDQHDPETGDGRTGDGGATDDEDAPLLPKVALAPPSALRETRPGLRAEATLDLPASGGAGQEQAADDPARAPEGRGLRRPGSVDLVFEPVPADDRVRPISTLGDPVEPLVIDDYVTEPAYDPVIGPELTAARTRLGLSVANIAERTRIRPHVIESIEVDDFAPCGGDFYARGHLRTLARILGKDPAPLLERFEERYATAPVNARRVFEAELATGMTGSMRSTVGGPSWGLLVGIVLVLVVVWGVLRLFTTEPQDPPPVIHGAAVVQIAPAPDV